MEERRYGKERKSGDGRVRKRIKSGKNTGSGKSIKFEKNIRSIKAFGRSVYGFCRRAAERVPRPILIGGVIKKDWTALLANTNFYILAAVFSLLSAYFDYQKSTGGKK